MNNREPEKLITIGTLARASGLSTGALRFYDDCRLLIPSRVDPSTGYRYYTDDQRGQASTIRGLREIGVSLDTISEILAADRNTASRLIDAHVNAIRRQADRAASAATVIKRSLGSTRFCTVDAASFATAIEHVAAFTAGDREIEVLAGILLEVDDVSVVLTATDRYRLSSRILIAEVSAAENWSAVVESDDLRAAVDWMRRSSSIELDPGAGGITMLGSDSTEISCRTIDQPFPDYRKMLAALPEVRTRAIVARAALAAVIELSGASAVQFTFDVSGITAISADAPDQAVGNATVTGPATTLWFDPHSLLAALPNGVGPEIMIDIAGPELPVAIRSATDGDLTTLAMPVAPPS